MINKSVRENWKEILMSQEHVGEGKIYSAVSN